MLRRPARRQPGAHRPHGPRAQAADVRHAREDGVQGDRGRVPLGVAARLRLRAPAHRGGPRPRRRHHPGARPVPPGADRAHLRVPARLALGHRPLLQLDLGPPASRGVRAGLRRHHRDRHLGGQAVPQARGDDGRHEDPLRVLARELHRHRAAVRRGDLRGGHGRHRADRRPQDHPEPAGHGRDVPAVGVRRRDRVVRPHHPRPRQGDAVAPPAQRPRPGRVGRRGRRAGRRRPCGGHACSAMASAPATSTW